MNKQELEAKVKELEDKLAKYEPKEQEVLEPCEPQETLGEQFIITPPDKLVQIIKSTCMIKDGILYQGAKPIDLYKQIDPDTRVKYPKEYIIAVLNNEKPNISFLFYQDESGLFRSNHPFWSPNQRGTKVTTSNVCGVTIGTKKDNTLVSKTITANDLVNVVVKDDKVSYKGKEDKAFNIRNKIYTASYLRHLVEGTGKKKPLSMFYKVNNVIVRSEHKCWAAFKLQRVAESVNINDTNYTPEDLMNAPAISEKAYVKLLADNVFTMEDGQLLYAGKPFTKSRTFGGLIIEPNTILEIKDS